MRPLLAAFVCVALAPVASAAGPLKVLFLGDAGGHAPAARFRQLEPVFAGRGIALTYTSNVADLNPATLAKYAGLMVYANIETIAPDQEQALLDYVEKGGGYIPVHCASFCFQNSPKLIALTGAQFRSHTTGVFRTTVTAPDHPIVRAWTGFESWDETYLHHKHNPAGRTVLETRAERDVAEPWTWVRTQGKGRVFYTAWGHDQRTWSHPGFHALLERGTKWACGQDLASATKYVDAPVIVPGAGKESDFAYTPAKVPFYPAGEKWGTTAEPIGRMPLPLSPDKSMPHYSTPEGFKLELFAADADFQGGKPIATTWDERGRLWAAVTVDYPNEMQKPGQGRDKIVVLEDTDGDGRADTFTVFAENLSIPTALVCAFGGVVVHQAPDTLFLKDTDGDGKADLRQTLFTGWGTKDTHAGPSNLRHGFDGHIYGMCGYSGFNGTVHGEKVKFGQGFHRIKLARAPGDKHKLTAEKLEFLRSTNNNSWGVGFTEDGHLVGSTANGAPVVHLTIPNRYYEATAGLSAGPLANIALDNRYHPVTDKVRQVDWHGGFTSAAGLSVYTARAYPKEYWNKAAFVSDPTGHLTAAFMLQPAGGDFVARYGWNLAAATDEWAAPIDAQVGPDGHVWILDWYNYIVQHNPTPAGFETGKGNAYETPLRDKKHGRIYRVVYTAAKPDPRPDLATPDGLVATLTHPNMGWRLHAQRLLFERGNADVVDKLIALTQDQSVDEAGLNAGVLHAVWTLAGLHAGADAVAAARSHPSPAVRRAAILAGDARAVAALDAGPDLRLAQLLRLADAPASDAPAKLLAALLADGTGWRADLVTLSPAERDAVVIAAAAHAEPLVRTLAAVAGPVPADASKLLEAAARAAATRDPTLVDRVLANGPNPTLAGPLAAGFAAGLPSGKKQAFTPAGAAGFLAALKAATPAARPHLLKLAGRFSGTGLDAQLSGVVAELLAAAADPNAAPAARAAAARQAVELRPADAATGQKLVDLLTPAATPELTDSVLAALGQSTAPAVGTAVVAKLKTLPTAARPTALRLVLARPEPTAAFLDAVEAGTVRFDLLALDQKTALAGHPDAGIAARAKKLLALGGGLPDADRQKVIAALHPVLGKGGDVANGKKVYAAHCAKCHRHGDTGVAIGPDLTGMAVHPKEELLIAILDPSRSVEGNFRTYTANTLDGRVVTGLLAAETRTAVELVDAENVRHALRRDDLDTLTESPKSLMPEGFEKQMTPADLGDLLAFLTAKGKYVPIPLDKVATVDTTHGMFFASDGPVERLIFPDWSPKVAGGVPFVLADPTKGRPNAVLLYGPNGVVAPKMPKAVTLQCNTSAKAIHLLGGVGGWAFPASTRGTTSLVVRLHYAGGTTEDHKLVNGVHLADYVRRVDVPQSTFAFDLGGRQVRTVVVTPKTGQVIERIELVKGPDDTAPVVLAVTVETP